MRGNPPTFSYAANPIESEDWLRVLERDLRAAQCTDHEMVLYGPRQLRGTALEWWEAYLAAHESPDYITWDEFKESFRRHHVLEGTITMKKEEFLALKQGSTSVGEYRNCFIQLSRYAPEEVFTDKKKQSHFLKGLIDLL